MHDRRIFLQKMGLLGASILFQQEVGALFPDGTPSWKTIARCFPVRSYPYLHLNTGSAGTMPRQVEKAAIAFLQKMNRQPPYEAWEAWQTLRKDNKRLLSQLLGSQDDEIAVVRNTTEGMNNLILGIPMAAGDEIVLADHDYPFVQNATKQRAERENLHLQRIAIDLSTASDHQIVQAYINALSPKTKLLILPHITHREGRILPIRAITERLPASVQVVLDAAHSFAHIDFNIKKLGVSYMATSLHKWLNAPYGTGLLYIQKDKIPDISPIGGTYKEQAERIEKFENLGTRAFYSEMAIGAALAFHHWIGGTQRKQERLHYLKQYWTDAVKDIQNIVLKTPLGAHQSCAIASFCLKKRGNFAKILQEKYGIHAKNVALASGTAVRISTNVFLQERDLDRLTDALSKMSQ